MNQEDFEDLDSNNNGKLSTDEVFDAFIAMFNPSGRTSNSLKVFSNNGEQLHFSTETDFF